MISPFVIYAPDASLDDEAREWGESNASSSPELHAYINSASGSESLEAIYGHEPWRLEKLRRLKAEYGPDGKFSYYGPIH